MRSYSRMFLIIQSLPKMPYSTRSNKDDWYILYTRSKFEKKILMQIPEMDVEGYLPLQTVTRKWSDRLKKIQIPFFSNYIFVRASMEKCASLLQIPGALKFVSFQGEPAYIPDKEIQKIRLIEANQVAVENVSYYVSGDKVKIMKGVFHGIEGILIWKIKETRFVIRIPMFRQAISFEININDVSKV